MIENDVSQLSAYWSQSFIQPALADLRGIASKVTSLLTGRLCPSFIYQSKGRTDKWTGLINGQN